MGRREAELAQIYLKAHHFSFLPLPCRASPWQDRLLLLNSLLGDCRAQRPLILGWGGILPFSSCLHTSIPIYQAGLPPIFPCVFPPLLCGYVHYNCCKPGRLWRSRQRAQCCRDSPESQSQQAMARPQITGDMEMQLACLNHPAGPPGHPVHPPQRSQPFPPDWSAVSPPFPCSPSSCGLQRCIVGNSQVPPPPSASLPPLCARASSQGVTPSAGGQKVRAAAFLHACRGDEGAELPGVPSYQRSDVQRSCSR